MRHLALLLLSLLVAATPVERGRAPASSHPLDRVAVVGASATAGFGVVLRYIDDTGRKAYVPVGLDDLITTLIDHPGLRIVGEGSAAFFFNPTQMGRSQVDVVAEAKPTLVVALDFLFWHGYGRRGLDGKAIPPGAAGRSARLKLLERGLELLNSFDCPILLGDFPDVSRSVGRMLSPGQVPDQETLRLLNERVRAWIEAHPNAIPVPLSRLVEDMNSQEAFTAGGQTWPASENHGFMQDDQLHPTLEGLIILLQEAMYQLTEANVHPGPPRVKLDLEDNRAKIYEVLQPHGLRPLPYHLDQ